MDNATIHRLMVICKNHYVLRIIDDLFILTGADLNWCIKRAAPQGKSEREDKFNTAEWSLVCCAII